MRLIPCKHLDYDESKYDAELRDCAPDFPHVKYWYRINVPYEDTSRRVQFCKLREGLTEFFSVITGRWNAMSLMILEKAKIQVAIRRRLDE